MRVDRKRKKPARNICKRTLDKGLERDRSVGLSAMLLRRSHRKFKKNMLLVSGIFSGKINSAMLWVSNVL